MVCLPATRLNRASVLESIGSDLVSRVTRLLGSDWVGAWGRLHCCRELVFRMLYYLRFGKVLALPGPAIADGWLALNFYSFPPNRASASAGPKDEESTDLAKLWDGRKGEENKLCRRTIPTRCQS